MEVILDILVLLSLILSLFLSIYSIRSLVFFHIARMAARKNESLSHNNYFCNSKCESTIGSNIINSPFVSILVAAHNEELVLDRLMISCASLTYNPHEFEIIVVDDASDDDTYHILKKWTQKIPNLKVLRRIVRTGWKGGALNLALRNTNSNSSFVFVVDADNILVSDILERFVSSFLNSYSIHGNCVDVIQGHPIRRVYSNMSNNDYNLNKDNSNNCSLNWVAKGIDFRLAQRNMVEFLAKDHMSIPVQIIGSLFMIRSEVIKSLGFSNDISEDWDLTLNIYLSSYSKNKKSKKKKKNVIIFNSSLISYSEVTTNLTSYLRQRMRVSEGHTRGFRRRFVTILSSNTLPFIDKIELLFLGLHYIKFIPLLALIIIDSSTVLMSMPINLFYITSDHLVKLSLLIQAANLFITIEIICMSIPLCLNTRNYDAKDILYLLFLNLLTVPFLVLGCLRGMIKNKGIFYRTKRNS
jgi:cellulose synthase/poly-beta-1,6-N-acetylglucosamine synthase-like glycosyltransferase